MRTPTFLLALLLASVARAVGPGDILPKTAVYDPAVPSPEKALGVASGDRHLLHHELASYFRTLEKSSPRVKLLEYGKSFGGRALVYAVITSPENHKRLDEIRKEHLALCNQAAPLEPDTTLPAVVVMGYGVHGNEPSASNVAPLVAYHLVAGTGKEHEKLLQEVVILLDPCLNPDGFDRFANWANDNRGDTASPDPATREHREPWPTGRTNYYGFDLNRDWLPAQMPESQGRLAVYQQWKPNLVLDFHEMGTNSTYFFQPGHPKRVHPLIPPRNQELTRLLAKKHAAALDKVGALYFTGEQFDDYYPGKGSTYPDLHGGVGILFEQASSRGQMQDTPTGRITFPFTIRNQFLTSLSSLAGVQGLRPAFLEHQRKFYIEARAEGGKAVRGYLVAAPHDPARLHAFLDLLHRHDIRAHRTEATWGFGAGVKKGEVWWIPNDQPEYRFLQALFEQRTQFADSTFYDISAWSVPLAFGLKVQDLNEGPAQLGPLYQPDVLPPSIVEFAADDLAYAIDWHCLHAPALLQRLLAAGVKVNVAGEMFAPTFGGPKLPPGTLVVPLGIQADKRAVVVEMLKAALPQAVTILPIRTGQTAAGITLGSERFQPVKVPRVLLVVGEGVNVYEAGEVWHALDRRVGMPLTRVETTRLGSVDLDRYSVVVMVSGTYGAVTPAGVERLKDYVAKGGTLLAQGTSIPWLKSRGVIAATLREPKVAPGTAPYNQADDEANKQAIRGAIFQVQVDATHPLGFGYDPAVPLALFRSNRVILERAENAYSTPLVYLKEKPLLAGYVSEENLTALAGSGAGVVVGVGTGRAILIPDAPLFRAYWRGSEKVFLNAVFFGPLTKVPGASPGDDDEG